MTQETQQERAYKELNPVFRVSSPEELKSLETSLHILEENVRMVPGSTIPHSRVSWPISVLVSTLPNGVRVQPIYHNAFESIMPYREGKAKISVVKQDHVVINIEDKLYEVYLNEKKPE